ncbi:TonB-dependent receptor [Gluconacetobacter sacchari]|uniref:TonB-dependent receptor n=1 Tax=Gluconacetobacter sacchari TaxID=92759 RepID=UPI0039B4F497
MPRRRRFSPTPSARHPLSALLVLAVFARQSDPALADTSTAQGPAVPIQTRPEEQAGRPARLETIVVTARKTREALQNVPESITVVRPAAIEALRLEPVEAIARNAPNTLWTNWGSAASFLSIRGVSSLGTPLNNNDGTVSFNIDGVPGSMLSLNNPLLDVKQAEVLRGPQGTLWGANSLGGTINVTTNQPDGTRDIHVTAEGGSNGYGMGEAVAGGRIVPGELDARLAIRFSGYGGDVASLHTPQLNARNIQAFRGGFRFIARDGTTATLTANYSHDGDDAPFFLLRSARNFPISGSLTKPNAEIQQGGATLTVQHRSDRFNLTSLTAFQHNVSNVYVDRTDQIVDEKLGLPSFLITSSPGFTDDTENIYSQELRLNSLEGAPLRWVLGTSAIYTDADRDFSSAANVVPMTAISHLRTLNYGLFGDTTVNLSERWAISLGGRFSYDKIWATDSNSAHLASLAGRSTTDQPYPTGRVALAYKWSSDVTSYVSAARGHSSRIYPLYAMPVNGALSSPYPAGTGWTYEAGTKMNLLSGRADMEVSAFYNSIHDGVLTYLNPSTVQFMTSYQNYHTEGFEAQGRVMLVTDLILDGGVGYTRATLGRGSSGASFKGNDVPNVPDWTANIGLHYTAQATRLGLSGTIPVGITYQYVGARTADVENSFGLHPYGLVNVNIGWQNRGGDLKIYAFARNLLDTRYEVYGASLDNQATVMVGTGRIAGGGISKSF